MVVLVTVVVQEVMRPFDGIWHPLYLAILNHIGPSTEYHRPTMPTATACGPMDPRKCIYVGDEFYVNITVVRHRLNGSCLFKIVRYAEHVGGPHHGERHAVSYANLRFVGQNEMREIRWPTPPDRYVLGYEVDENNNPIMDRPLLPDGVDEQEFRFYVVGRYYCNYLDDIIPRYIQGGERPNETANVRAVLRRHKP